MVKMLVGNALLWYFISICKRTKYEAPHSAQKLAVMVN